MILDNTQLRVDIVGAGITIKHNGTIWDKDIPKLTFDTTAVTGLWDIPTMNADKTSRPISHGAFYDRGYTDARLIELSGHAFSVDDVGLYELRDKLAGALSTGQKMTFVFYFGNSKRIVEGRLEGTLDWTIQRSNYAQWKFSILCPDPRLYSDWRNVQLGSIDVQRTGLGFSIDYPVSFTSTLDMPVQGVCTNKGNSIAYPVFSTNVNSTGFTIRSGSQVLTFTGTTTKASTVVVDTFTGQVTVGGADRSYLLTKRDWITIPPYGTITPTVDFVSTPEEEGSAIMYVKYRDTWI